MVTSLAARGPSGPVRPPQPRCTSRSRSTARAASGLPTLVHPSSLVSSPVSVERSRTGFCLGLRARALSEASARTSGSPGLPPKAVSGRGPRALHKGLSLLAVHAFSFASPRPVTQPVTRLNFFKGAALNEHPLQGEFPLLARMEGPAVVPAELMRTVSTFRQVCRLAWQLRRVRNMSFRQLAAEAGLTFQHVTDYFHADDLPRRRDLPAEKIGPVEVVLGNSAISQYLAARSKLTVLEEMQASRRAA